MPDEHEPITEEELEEAHAEPLPDREVMTTIDPSGGSSYGLGPPVLGDPGYTGDPPAA